LRLHCSGFQAISELSNVLGQLQKLTAPLKARGGGCYASRSCTGANINLGLGFEGRARSMPELAREQES
jgi:hypothetical protein